MLQRPRTIAVFIVLVFLTAFVSTLSAQTFTLTSISPTHGYAGDQITLGGTNFGAVQGTGGLVNIGSAWATVVSWSDTQIVATVPYSGTGPVKVKQNGVFSNSIDFTFDAPILTSITPTHGFTGDQMTLVGSHFGATQGTVGLVWIGATWGTVVSWSDTQIVATVPYSGAGPVKVKQNGVFSNSIDFTFDTPTLTSISPTHGYAGDQITLVGSHFNPVAGTGGLVWLGAGWATVVSWSDTQIVATIPYQNAGPVKVKQYGVFSNSINFTFDAATLTSISPTHGYAGDQITLVGSHFGTVQGLVQIGPNWATVVSWSDSQIVVTAPFSSAGAVKIRQDNVWSNGINFTYDAPTLASVTPSSSAIGAQITLAGSHFGTQQSTSRVQLGSIVATVQSWADNQIVATVPSASSGTLAVFQNAVWSNGLSFTVLPNPSITSLTPSSGSVGTSVTITGANLGSSGTVSFNGVAASPSSWSSTSITVPVPNGATTGNVVVTASGLNTSGLLFTVPPPTPLLVQLNPTSGIPGTSVTITGSNFGSTQNNGQVLISAIPLTVTSWGDNTIIATIADEVDTGSPLPITVITGTGTSNQLQFTPTDPPITGVSLTPDKASMVVGETRTFKAKDAYGSDLTGLTWTSSDTSILSLSTDDPPVVTALAPGEVTLAANDATATITVYPDAVLPTGTVKWSVQGDGTGVTKILPAVPSSTGVADVFAVQNSGQVLALTADGSTAWMAFAPSAGWVLPDFQGGLVVGYANQVQKFDGITGQPYPPFSTSFNPSDPSTFINGVVVHTDGTIFAVTGNSLVGIDPTTGQLKFSVPIEHSTSNFPNVAPSYPAIILNNPIVAGDGYAYLAYQYKTGTYTNSSHGHIDAYLKLLRVAPNGDFQKIEVKKMSTNYATDIVPGPNWNYGVYYCDGACATWPYGPFVCSHDPNCIAHSTVEVCDIQPYCTQSQIIQTSAGLVSSDPSWREFLGTHLITNADKGVILSFGVQHEGWQYDYTSALSPCAPNCQGTSSHSDGADVNYLTTVSSNGDVTPSTSTALLNPTLQREDGSYIGVMQVDDATWMTSFDKDGDVLWRQQGDYQPLMATADGGVIARLSTSNGVFRVTLDGSGNIVSQTSDNTQIQSWTGNVYKYGSVEQIVVSPVQMAASFWPATGANVSTNQTAAIEEKLYMRSFAPFPWFGPEPLLPPYFCPFDCFAGDNRTFSTSTDPSVTSRVVGIVNFLIPGLVVSKTDKYSDWSEDIYGRGRKGIPKIIFTSKGDGNLHVETAGSNPLILSAPDIDTKLDISGQTNAGQICYSGHLFGDAFPNAEVFVVNSKKQATMLITFTTQADRNVGPVSLLPGNNSRDMGSFSSTCVDK